MIAATAVFTNLSAGSSPISYKWDFGDGSVLSTAVYPTHVYVSPGIYTVRLTVTNPFGSMTVSHKFIVEREPIKPLYVYLYLPMFIKL
jgi:PKD repeat protein